MEYICNICNKNFKTQGSLEQHTLAKHSKSEENNKGKINWRRYFIFTVIGLIILFSILSIRSYIAKPGEYDEFAQCLTEKGAVVYGNDYCQYTIKQLNFFGKSQRYLNYVKCLDNKGLCDSKSVSITPTWEINDETYSGVQTFERLSAVTDCEI